MTIKGRCIILSITLEMITKIQNVFKEAFHFLVIICNLKKNQIQTLLIRLHLHHQITEPGFGEI